jgi:hypothetical protein
MSKKTHGHRHPMTGTYRSWANMKTRCDNPSATYYADYGGRGIAYCDRWKHFENFLEDMDVRPVDKTLDRIDTDKGYYKDNCRWATPREQACNRTNTISFTYQGVTKPLALWADDLALPYHTLYLRIFSRGYTVERAFSTPHRKTLKKGEAHRNLID